MPIQSITNGLFSGFNTISRATLFSSLFFIIIGSITPLLSFAETEADQDKKVRSAVVHQLLILKEQSNPKENILEQNKSSNSLDINVTESPEAPEVVESTEAPEVVESVEAPETVESTKAPEAVESAEAPEAVESAEAPKAVESAEAPKAVESAEAPKAVESAETPKAVESAETPKAVESAEAPEVVESAEAPEVVESAEAPKVVESAEAPKVVESAEAPKVVESAEAPSSKVSKIPKKVEKEAKPIQKNINITKKKEETTNKVKPAKKDKTKDNNKKSATLVEFLSEEELNELMKDVMQPKSSSPPTQTKSKDKEAIPVGRIQLGRNIPGTPIDSLIETGWIYLGHFEEKKWQTQTLDVGDKLPQIGNFYSVKATMINVRDALPQKGKMGKTIKAVKHKDEVKILKIRGLGRNRAHYWAKIAWQ